MESSPGEERIRETISRTQSCVDGSYSAERCPCRPGSSAAALHADLRGGPRVAMILVLRMDPAKWRFEQRRNQKGEANPWIWRNSGTWSARVISAAYPRQRYFRSLHGDESRKRRTGASRGLREAGRKSRAVKRSRSKCAGGNRGRYPARARRPAGNQRGQKDAAAMTTVSGLHAAERRQRPILRRLPRPGQEDSRPPRIGRSDRGGIAATSGVRNSLMRRLSNG